MFLHPSVILFKEGLPQCMLGYTPKQPPPSSPEADTLLEQMATAADGMHPTWMHSCFTSVCHSVHRWGECMPGRACVPRGWGHAYLGGGVAGGVRGRRDGHCSGRYASYWNAFLLRGHFEVFQNAGYFVTPKVWLQSFGYFITSPRHT